MAREWWRRLNLTDDHFAYLCAFDDLLYGIDSSAELDKMGRRIRARIPDRRASLGSDMGCQHRATLRRDLSEAIDLILANICSR